MDYYIDIQVLPGSEFPDSIIINKLFSNLHKRLVDCGYGEIGVSFPKVNKTLGSILRLHGLQASLQRLMNKNWVESLMDYITVSEMIKVPTDVRYRIVKRVQSKSSTERLLRRSVRKGWITEEEAVLRAENKIDKKLSLPYVSLKSHSTGQMFNVFIEHGSILINPVEGVFSAYGLSTVATIPWF